MATKSIAWLTGSGYITAIYDGSGNGTIQITSDANNLYEDRSMQIVVKTTDGSNISKTISITQAAKIRTNISNAVVTAPNQTYSGSAFTPTPTVTLNGEVIPSTGYDVTYSNNINAGTATITVTGKGDYTGTAIGVFTINKANPTYIAPTAKTGLVFTGDAQALLNAGSTSHGTIQYSSDNSSWSTAIPSQTNANPNGFISYWKLVGDSNHTDVASTILITAIAKASQDAPTATGASVSYGNVATATASGGGGQGSIEWSNGNTLSGNVGSKTTKARWSGNSNYNASVWSNEVTLSITKANPVITAPTAKSNLIYNGSSQTLYNAGSNTTPGSFSYTNGTRTNAGSQTVSWSFTPTDTTNYNSMNGSFSASIAKAAGSVSISGVSLNYDGNSKNLATVSGATGTMHYSIDYSNWSTSIPSSTNAGSWAIYWYMDESTNYEGISANTSRYVSSIINKATPSIIVYPTNANPTYNGGAQYLLTGGTANVAGTFSYSTGTNAGSYTATWWFTPSDTTNYNSISGTVAATIAKASRTLSFSPTYVVIDTSGTITKTPTVSAGSGDGAITYTISNTTYATINASSGKVTAKTSDGSATVTATIAEGTNYLSASASYTLYVFATTHNFAYTGSVQNVTLPPGSYKLQCWGAQGGATQGYGNNNKGGYSEGVVTVTGNTTVYVFVGGQGAASGNGGWNGGGGGPGSSSYNSGGENGSSYYACGGGSTDISTVTSSMSYSSYRTNRSDASLLARCIVAGGGSGGAYGSKKVSTTVKSKTQVFSTNTAGKTRWHNSLGYIISPGYAWSSGKKYILEFSGTTPNSLIIEWSSGGYSKYSWSTGTLDNPWAPGGNGTVEIAWNDNYHDGTFTVYEVTETTTTDTTTDYSNGYSGGGTSGRGYTNALIGKINAAGTGSVNGGFGYGANQTVTSYRYCAGCGGGGWYGGATTYADSNVGTVNYSGGGSGWVNIAANASYRPNGYTGLQLDSGTTKDGKTSFESPSGGNETGHAGNGYARITRIS